MCRLIVLTSFIAISVPTRVSASPKLECTSDAAWPRPRPGEGRFVLDSEGGIDVIDARPHLTISFTHTKHAYAIVETIPSDNSDPITLACGPVASGQRYDLADLGSPELRPEKLPTQLAIRLFDVPKNDKYLVAYRDTKLTDVGQKERDAVHAEPTVRELAAVARAAATSPTHAALRTSLAAATATRERLDEIQRDWYCSTPDPRGLLGPAICDEAFATAKAVEALDSALRQHEDDPTTRLADAAGALKLVAFPSEGARTAQCNAIKELRWLYAPGNPRLVNRAQLPITDRVIEISYNTKPTKPATVDPHLHYAVLVSNVPTGGKVSFARHEGASTVLDITVLFSALVTAAFKALPGPLRGPTPTSPTLKQQLDKTRADLKDLAPQTDILGVSDLIEMWTRPDVALQRRVLSYREDALVAELEHLDAPYAAPSLLCRDPSDDLRVDERQPPQSGAAAVAYDLGAPSDDHELIVGLCNSEACSVDDDKLVKSRVTLRPRERGRWTLLAELGAGVAVDAEEGLGSLGFHELSPPAFQPVFGSDGPDQLFELRQVSDSHNVISTALLVARHLDEDWLWGIGPTLLIGTSGSLAAQWNLRLGREISSGIYFTFGPSVRAIQFPDDYKVGDRVSVPRAATGMTAAPQVAMHYEPVFGLQVGIAFDLAKLGGVAGDLSKALGVGK